MKKTKPKAATKKGEAKAKKKVGFTISAQEKACAEVVGDLWEIIVKDNDELGNITVENIINERGVSKEFLQELMDSRAIERDRKEEKAIAALKAAYNILPKDLQEAIAQMDSQDMCEAICGTKTDEED